MDAYTLPSLKATVTLTADRLESYRNSDGRQAKRSIMTIGYLDQTGHDLAYYEQLVVKMNQDKKEEAFQTVRIDMNAPLLSGNNLLNVGYFALKYIYLELGLPAFLSDIQKRTECRLFCPQIYLP